MPKVHKVFHCRKPTKCGKCGRKIRKGDTYFWWKFNYGERVDRCNRDECFPDPSDLTRSVFIGAVQDIKAIGFDYCNTLAQLKARRDELVPIFKKLQAEVQAKWDKMPAGYNVGDIGKLLKERIASCRYVASALEGVHIPEERKVEEKRDDEAGKRDDRAAESTFSETRDELQALIDNIDVT